jgi:hypothetical protein
MDRDYETQPVAQPPYAGQQREGQPGYAEPPYGAQQGMPAAPPGYPQQWPQQPYPPPQRGMDAGEFARRYIRTPETKEFFKTSEFVAFVLATAAVLIASVIDDGFDAFEAWLLVTALTVGYMLSRGLSKSGARKDDPARAGDHRGG